MESNHTISRIFKAQHLLDDLKNNTITFSHPSSFDDIWELQNEHLFFIQCWGINQNNASWEIYDRDKTGLRVVIDCYAFDVNYKILGNILPHYELRYMKVDYTKSDEEIEKLHQDILNLNPNQDNKKQILEFLQYKKKYYEFENELRFILVLDTKRKYLKDIELQTKWNNSLNRNTRILKIKPFQWKNIIQYIEINPLTPKRYKEYITEQLMLRGIEEAKIYYKGYPTRIKNLDFNLFLESYSNGGYNYIEKLKHISQENGRTQNDFPNINDLPEHIVFNMAVNYLDSFFNGLVRQKQVFLERNVLPIFEKLEKSEDKTTLQLLLFLTIYLGDVENFIKIFKHLTKDQETIQTLESKKHNFIFFPTTNLQQALLEIWQEWQVNNTKEPYKRLYEWYLESYKQYQEHKKLNSNHSDFKY